LYNFDEAANSAEFFQIAGPLSKHFSLIPKQFKMRSTEKTVKALE
jgi:hypothetical protein